MFFCPTVSAKGVVCPFAPYHLDFSIVLALLAFSLVLVVAFFYINQHFLTVLSHLFEVDAFLLSLHGGLLPIKRGSSLPFCEYDSTML